MVNLGFGAESDCLHENVGMAESIQTRFSTRRQHLMGPGGGPGIRIIFSLVQSKEINHGQGSDPDC